MKYGFLQTDCYGKPMDKGVLGTVVLSTTQAAAADDDGILASFAVTDAADVTKTEFAAQPPYPRNITVKTTGTAGNVKAGTATITGIDMDGNEITESVTITADTAVNFTGAKAFVAITKFTFPAMDGTVNVKVGWGDLYGLPYKFASKPLALGSVDGTMETVKFTVNASDLAKNTFTFDSAPVGEAVKVAIIL